MTIEDIKQIADLQLETAKTLLVKNGRLTPVVFAVKESKEIIVIGLAEFDDKHEAFQAVAQELLKIQPEAAIMINDAYMRKYAKGEGDKAFEEYKDGDYSVDPEAVECIVVAFKGPNIPAHMRSIPYERGPLGDIVFKDEPLDWCEGQFNLMPDWWSIKATISGRIPDEIREAIGVMKARGWTKEKCRAMAARAWKLPEENIDMDWFDSIPAIDLPE